MIYTPQRRADDGFLKRVGRFFKWFFIMVGVMATVGPLLIMLVAGHGQSVPDNVLLTYTFKSGINEIADGPTLSQPLPHSTTTFHELIEALTEAAKDTRVKGFAAKLQGINMSPAQLQELRDTIGKLRAAGKPTYIYAEGLAGSSMGDYYLASSFGQIWLQPVGTVSMNGVAVEVPFFKKVLDKVGVEAEFSRKGTYKSLPESLTLTGMSAPHREMMTELVGDLAEQMSAGIAAGRGLKADSMKQLVNGAPYTGEEALKLKLIDRIGYYDDMLVAAKQAAGITEDRTAGTLDLKDYSSNVDKHAGKQKIALIIGAGDIVSYKETHASLNGGADMAADKIAGAFEKARKDKNVAAVVFRIDSPGGSPEAAETIRHAIIATQKKGIPVIVSMGGYAASGGYWIAAPADKIVAEPATITGSIGVFGGKFVFAGLWDKIGVHWDSVSSNENARMFSSNAPFTAQQRERFEAMLDEIYKSFIARVAEGRKLTPAQVESVAEGHVWTGRQAKERGLVDELGGFDKALVLAKAAAKIRPDQDVTVKKFSGEKSFLETLLDFISGDNNDDDTSLLPSISAKDILNELRAEAESRTGLLKMPDVQLH